MYGYMYCTTTSTLTNMAGSSTREVITLQFGHYSNFVGTHWLNIQESSFCYDPNSSNQQEINHDVLFREGLTSRGQQTYTPRLMIFDLKGSLRSLPQYGTLYQTSSYHNESPWWGEVSVHESEPEPKNEFQLDLEAEELEAMAVDNRTRDQAYAVDNETINRPSISFVGEDDDRPLREKFYDLDQDISVWSDFLGTSLHPRSIQLVRDFLHGGHANPFDVFGYGEGVAKDEYFYDEFESSLHFFVEECDSLQGFQIFADVCNGFGGLCNYLLEELKDEYGRKSFVTFGMTETQLPDGTTKETAYRILNSALSYGQLSQHSDIFIPLSLASEAVPHTGPPREFPLLNYKPYLSYHTSSVLGVCVDTITMPYRLITQQASNMSSFIDSVAHGERKIASLSSSFPLPVDENNSLASFLGSRLQSYGREILQCISPGVSNSSSLISQSSVVRGIPVTHAYNPEKNISTQASLQSKNPLEACASANEIVRTFLENVHPNTSPLCWNVNQACMVKPPFPNIFAPKVNSYGFSVEGYVRPENTRVNQTNVLSRLETNSSIGSMLLSLVQWAKKSNISKHHVFLESGIEVESFNGLLEELSSLSQRYENP